VLLKNDKEILPLNATSSIALVGPLAAARTDLLGPWSGAGEGEKCISVLEALQERATRDGFKLSHAKGCEIEGHDRVGFGEAIRISRAADIIVAVVGENKEMSGEASARADITLPGVQEEFLKALVATGKPVVVVLMNGRPLAIPWMAENVTAIVESWWLGTQAGPAIGDVLYGDYNPSGKLTMTFPRHIGQIPIFYNEKNTGRPYDPDTKWNTRYLDMPNSPQYPFGFGLSYTSFAYDSLQIGKTEYSFRDTIEMSVLVTNTGDRSGEEIVQLYVRDLTGSVTRPVKELKGFEKIKLEAGAHKNVIFKLTSRDFAFHTADMSFTAEPGVFWLMVGPDSERLQIREIRLVK
jgi:beta-glucosidase